MSDSMIQAMQRMEQIRSRIEEIRRLGEAGNLQKQNATQAADATGGAGSAASFALLLEEAGASLTRDESGTGTDLASILETVTGNSLTAGQLTSNAGSADTTALIARALELYRKQQ